ncbi:hypothetical protein Tco_0946640, partial [Tanacetum coccineum]
MFSHLHAPLEEKCFVTTTSHLLLLPVYISTAQSHFSYYASWRVLLETKKNVEVEVDDTEELKNCLEIVPEDEDDVTVDATPLDDLEDLWKIVKSRFIKKDPVDDMDNLLLRTLNTMFEPQVEDTIWTYQQGLTKVKNWKLYDSCGNDVRLQVDYEVGMAYELLRLLEKLEDSRVNIKFRGGLLGIKVFIEFLLL